MKKLFTFIFVALLTCGLYAQKTLVFTEYFENIAAGTNLEGNNGWTCVAGDNTTSKSPTVVHQALNYAGYKSSGIGNTITLDAVDNYSTTANIRNSVKAEIPWDESSLTLEAGETVYAAFLVKITEPNVSTSQFRDFFNLYFKGGTNTSAEPSPRGRVHVATNKTTNKMVFGVSKNVSSNSQVTPYTDSLNIGDTHLLVLAYEINAGTNAKNDSVRLYINPDLSKPESEQINKVSISHPTDINNNDYQKGTPIGISLRQRETFAQIGGIRVGKSWQTVVLAKMPTPTNLIISEIRSRYFSVNWNAVEGAGGYEVKLLKGTSVVSTETVTGESKVFTGLDAETEYTCQIKALDTNTSSKFNPSDAATISVTTERLNIIALEEYNEWYRSANASSSAIPASPMIKDITLTYPGYISSGIGKVVGLNNLVESSSASISTKMIPWDEDSLRLNNAGEKIYTAFLVNFPEGNRTENTTRDFFSLNMTASNATEPRGRVFAKVNFADEQNPKIVFGITRQSTTGSHIIMSSDTLNAKDAHLLVLAYEITRDDTTPDKATLYINPDFTKTEDEQSGKIAATNASDLNLGSKGNYIAGTPIGINIRQRETAAQIGGIRVAKSWDAAVLGRMPAPTNPVVSDVSANSFTVSWSPAEGAKKYEVTLLEGETVLNTETIKGESKSFTGLNSETEYTCEIKAVDCNTVNKCDESEAVAVSTKTEEGTSSILDVNDNASMFYLVDNTIHTSQSGLIEVYNMQGMKVLKTEIADQYEIKLIPGIYIVRLTTVSGNICSLKVKL